MAIMTIPTGYYSAIASAESGNSDTAKNPGSSALGKYQFTTGTWNGLMAMHPELRLTANGRTDEAQQDRAIRALTTDNAQALSASNIKVTPANLYAAHFLGLDGAEAVLSQPSTTPMSNLVSSEVLKANPFLSKMTVGDFQNWTSEKVGNVHNSAAEAVTPSSTNRLTAAAFPYGGLTPSSSANFSAPAIPTNNLMALSLIGNLMNRPQQQMQMPPMQVQQPVSPIGGNQLAQIIRPYQPQFVTSGNALIPSFG